MVDDYGVRAAVAVPMWSESVGPGPDFATCVLYLDCGDDLAAIDPILRYWHDQACRLLLPAVTAPGVPEPTMSLSAHEQTADGRPRRKRPQQWSDGLTEDLYQLSAHWFDVAPAAIASELDLYVYRFADRRHVKLQVSVGFQDRPGGLPRVVPALVELTRLTGDLADPTYGEIVVNAGVLAPATMLDGALDRGIVESARASRQVLRGYEWVTVCPKELVGRLGGLATLRDSGAFSEVVPLRHGGALLRATDDPGAYQDGRVRAVHQALSPLLPAGEPTDVPGQDLSRLVFADARAAV